MPSNFVSNIQEDKNGDIWSSTGNGMSRYDGKSFSTVPINEKWKSKKDANIQRIASSGRWSLEEGDIWSTINNNGLVKYSDGEVEYLAFPIPVEDTGFVEEIEDKPYSCPYSAMTIYVDNSDRLWAGTFNRGVVGYDGNVFTCHNPDNFGIGTIRSIFQDKDGDLWFGSNGGGLYKYDGKEYVNYTKKLNLVSTNPGYDEPSTLSRVWSIEEDDEGNMWFGTADSGLWKYDGEDMINYTPENGLPSNLGWTIYKDNNGQQWFCSGMSSGSVLYTLKGDSFVIVQ